jgi:hypothetical protein
MNLTVVRPLVDKLYELDDVSVGELFKYFLIHVGEWMSVLGRTTQASDQYQPHLPT